MPGIAIIGLIIFLGIIYIWFFKPVKTYDDVIGRGFFLNAAGLKRKERDVYLKALKEAELTALQERDITFILGVCYVKNGECCKAVDCFDTCFKDFRDDFAYKKEFHQVIAVYLQCGENEKAKKMLEFFLARKTFDNKFAKLEKPYSHLL